MVGGGVLHSALLAVMFTWLTAVDMGELFLTCIKRHLQSWVLSLQAVIICRRSGYLAENIALTEILLHKTPRTTHCQWRNNTALCFCCHPLSLTPSIYKSLFISFSVCSLYWANKGHWLSATKTKNMDKPSEVDFSPQGVTTAPSAASIRSLKGN